MSASNSVKLKTNCDAVNSGHFIINQPISTNSSSSSSDSNAIKYVNNGTKLNSHKQPQQQEPVVFKTETSALKQESSVVDFQIQSQKFSDVQKVLKQEQELQKQLYSGTNVAPGWLRVNHNNKVIYISPSGIGLASLKQVKDYLLTRGTCKCGLPFPLRVELFFNFNTEVPTVPLKTPIESIKFDPTCQHRKRLTTNQTGQNQTENKRTKLNTAAKRPSGECLLPSYVTSATSKIINQSTTTNSSTVMIVNNGNALTATNVQPQIIQQSKPQQVTFQQQQQQRSQQQPQQFMQHDPSTGTNVVMRIVKDDGEADGVKLPPWKKNSMIQQKSVQQMMPSGIPIFQINGQNVIAIDQNNQQFHIQQPQQIQIIEHNRDGSEISQNWTTSDGKIGKAIIRRRPTFKEDPTGYLNQQTALLHNTITTLHSPDGSSSTTSSASPALQDGHENFQRTQIGQRQFIQQYVKAAPGQVTTIGGQTLTHMPNGVVQIQQNCDIKPQAKPMMIQEQIQLQQNKFIRQNPKGRPPKNPQTIAKRIAMSQESPVSSTSVGNTLKITKSNTPDITSSSHTPEAITESIVHSSSYDSADFVKFARSASTQEIRTSMTQVMAGKAITNTTMAGSMMKKPPQQMTMMKKPTTMIKNTGNVINAQNTGGQQIMMTSNGQQFIVMPSNIQQQQQQPQNIMLNNNGLMQIQNTNTTTNQRLIQASPGQGGNFIIQTSTGNVLANPGNFILSNNQQMNPLIIQNGQILQNTGNLLSPKGNILLSNGPGGKTIITGNNQQVMGQQTVLLNGIPNQMMMPTQTIIQDSSFMQNNQQHQQQQQQQAQRTIVMNPEKKKGRKRKIPLPESQQVNIQQQTQQQVTQQPNMIQMTPQGFQLASPNILKMQQPQQGHQIILQNGQTLIQQPMNLLGGQQLMLQPGNFPVMMSPDGNSIVQLQNPTFNNIIQTPQGMMIRAPLPQHQQQQTQKTIITNNGQQYIVNQAGQLSQMNQVFNSPMGFIVQAQQNQQQQIINAQQPIMMQSPTQGHQQIITQPQIITQAPSGMGQGTLIGQQQTQFITQSDGKMSSQRKIIHQKVQQQQKFFPQMIKPPRAVYSAAKNPIQTIVQEIEQPEEDEDEMPEDDDQEEVCEEMEPEEQELSFDDDDKPDMIQELHHGSQQVLHHSMMGDGQCGIMNIDDITIEMDEINDLNEYLNAIDEEDNRMAQMGLSSLQQFANSPPDTTTHSPRSPINTISDKSNGSSDSTNMVQFVSSSDTNCDSNVVSPEGVDSQQMSPLQNQSHYAGHSNMQPMFKLPMDPKTTAKSPMSSSMMSHMQLSNMMDKNQKSPLMRPDSHESASSDHETPVDETPNDDEVPAKSDFDLLKESPPVNTIKPIASDVIESEDTMFASQDSPISPTTSAVTQTSSNFKIGDLIWGATRGCDAWPGKVVNGPDGEPNSSDCVWVKWFGGRQNTEMMLCSTLKSLSEGLEAHHAAQKDTRKGRKLNSHLERAIQKAMSELDKESNANKGSSEKKPVTSSNKSPKTKLIKIAPAPDKK